MYYKYNMFWGLLVQPGRNLDARKQGGGIVINCKKLLYRGCIFFKILILHPARLQGFKNFLNASGRDAAF